VFEFTDVDWTRLNSIVENRDSTWLVRCAETLGDINSKLAFEVLMKLTANEDIEVQISALDSINALLSTLCIDDGSMSDLRERVSQLETSSNVVKIMLSSLMKKIS